MGSEYVEYLFDPFRGDIAPGTISKQPTELAVRPGSWKVTCIADRVHVFAHDSRDEEIAGGAWQDGTIADRSGAVDGEQWKMIESTLRDAVAWTPPPPPPTTGPAVQAAPKKAGRPNPGRLVAVTALAAWAAMFAVIWGFQTVDRKETWVEYAVEAVLLVMALGLTVYGFAGLTSACLRCRAWFQRERTERESNGQRYAADGRTFNDYVDHFRCRSCGRTWKVSYWK